MSTVFRIGGRDYPVDPPPRPRREPTPPVNQKHLRQYDLVVIVKTSRIARVEATSAERALQIGQSLDPSAFEEHGSIRSKMRAVLRRPHVGGP